MDVYSAGITIIVPENPVLQIKKSNSVIDILHL